MTVRAKFTCQTVEPWGSGVSSDVAGTGGGTGSRAVFVPVYSGSEENEKFFELTPGGTLTLETIRDHKFEAGKEYYLDITLAE